MIGGMKETQDCIDFCAKHNILPTTQVLHNTYPTTAGTTYHTTQVFRTYPTTQVLQIPPPRYYKHMHLHPGKYCAAYVHFTVYVFAGRPWIQLLAKFIFKKQFF